MNTAENSQDNESFNRTFCEHLEFHLSRTFANCDDKDLQGLWCDGILDPFIESQLTKESVNETRKIVTTAFIGNDGQGKYEMTLKFGPLALNRYAKGTSMIECLPSEESMEWITIDIEKRTIEVRLK